MYYLENLSNLILDGWAVTLIKRYFFSYMLDFKPINIGNLTFIFDKSGSLSIEASDEFKKALVSEDYRKEFMSNYYKNKIKEAFNDTLGFNDKYKIGEAATVRELISVLRSEGFPELDAKYIGFLLLEFFEFGLLSEGITCRFFDILPDDKGNIRVKYHDLYTSFIKRMASSELVLNVESLPEVASMLGIKYDDLDVRKVWEEYFKKKIKR